MPPRPPSRRSRCVWRPSHGARRETRNAKGSSLLRGFPAVRASLRKSLENFQSLFQPLIEAVRGLFIVPGDSQPNVQEIAAPTR